MPPKSNEDVLKMTKSHIEFTTEKLNQMQQLKGQTQTILSMLTFVQEHAEEIETELNLETIAEASSATEKLKKQIDYWIERTASAQDTLRSLQSGAQTAKSLGLSLAEVDEDLPETVEALEANFEDLRDSSMQLIDTTETGIEILEQIFICLIGTPEEDKLAESVTMLKEFHDDINEKLDVN